MATEHTQLLGGGSGSPNTWKIPVKAEMCAGGLSGWEGELSDDRPSCLLEGWILQKGHPVQSSEGKNKETC